MFCRLLRAQCCDFLRVAIVDPLPPFGLGRMSGPGETARVDLASCEWCGGTGGVTQELASGDGWNSVGDVAVGTSASATGGCRGTGVARSFSAAAEGGRKGGVARPRVSSLSGSPLHMRRATLLLLLMGPSRPPVAIESLKPSGSSLVSSAERSTRVVLMCCGPCSRAAVRLLE
jgi:hypothetical protein